MLANKLAGSGAASKQYIEELFSAYTYTGNGSTQTITNGIDLATYGGAVHIKYRDGVSAQSYHTTAVGITQQLVLNGTGGASGVLPNYVTAATSSGFSLGDALNGAGLRYGSWTYRNAPKFYTHSTKSHTNGVASTVDLSTLGTVGMVRVKRTDGVGNWVVWHRSLSAGFLLYGNLTQAATGDSTYSMSGTTLTIAAEVVTGTYLVEAWAHDTSADGLIQCGSFTTDGSGNATVTLGIEPQAVEIKRIDSTGSWYLLDTMRGWSQSADNYLLENSSGAEASADIGHPTATGFQILNSIGASATFVYRAIRRGPMKPPTSGTQVYQGVTSSGASGTVLPVGFPADMCIAAGRGAIEKGVVDRLRGYGTSATVGPMNWLRTHSTDAEYNPASYSVLYDVGMDSAKIGAYMATYSVMYYFFRRYPGVFDQVCYTGTGTTNYVKHNLGVAPELMIVKNRSATADWFTVVGAYRGFLNKTDAMTNDGWPHNAVDLGGFGNSPATNAAGNNYVAYLFATLAGISKVGSYTGNGTSRAIDCGFATGARFVMIKRTDVAGHWWVWDTVRGIVAGNDPYLALSSTNAENWVGAGDEIDPTSAGFIVNNTANTQVNLSGATYIYLALA